MNNILQGYTDFVLTYLRKPSSVHVLCKHIEIEESEFYQSFASISALEKALWLNYFVETYQRVTEAEVYASYSVREKLLSFYYTWIEVLKPHKSYVAHTIAHTDCFDLKPNYLKDFETTFMDYAQNLLQEARETDEFPERMFVQNIYPNILWKQAKSVLHYWAKDSSDNFEKTDAFIEKNVNFTCDSFSRSFLDSGFEYLTFIFKG